MSPTHRQPLPAYAAPKALAMQSWRRFTLHCTQTEALRRMVSSIRYTMAVLNYNTSLPRIVVEEFRKSYPDSSLGDLAKLKFKTWAAEVERDNARHLARDGSSDGIDDQADDGDVDVDSDTEMADEEVPDESDDEADESQSDGGGSHQDGPHEAQVRDQEPDGPSLTPQMEALLANRRRAVEDCRNSTINAMVELINLAIVIYPDEEKVSKAAYQVLQSHYPLHRALDVSFSNIDEVIDDFIVPG